jgi:hypothetical protein
MLHKLIPAYRDATMDLIDALSTNINYQSVIQLSDNKFFRRKYSSINKVIHYFLVSNEDDGQDAQKNKSGSCSTPVDANYQPNKQIQKAIQKQIVNLCPTPEHRNFFYSPVMLLRL